jgi:glycosyltransferase 2 family protein
LHSASVLTPPVTEVVAPPRLSAVTTPLPAEPSAQPSTQPSTARRSLLRAAWPWLRPVVGIGILAVLLWRLGTGPFLDGLAMIDGWAVAAALLIGGATTVCCAWRWSTVAAGLGVPIPLRTAVADCYRSIFLNATLPGGVLGDVHRAVSHGRDAGDVSRGIRAVVWERTAGQVVQLALSLVVLSVFPSPVRGAMPVVIGVAVGAVLLLAVVATLLPRAGVSRWAHARWAKVLVTARTDIRDALLAPRQCVRVVIASALAVAGHLALFLVAAQTAGATAPLARLAPLTLLALLAMGLPANVGGFGPREGVAAWAYAAAGLTATQGVTTAVVYGALVLVSSLPGAAVLVARRLPKEHRRVPTAVSPEGVARA